MSDFTTVYFKGLEKGFNVPSVLTDFSFFGLNLSVRWYGVIIALGFIAAVFWGGRLAYKWKMNLDKMLDVLIYSTLFGIIGARLFYVISEWDTYKNNISAIFQIWEGGLAIYGGLIGGLIAAVIVCRVRKINLLNLLDICALSLPLGQAIGRFGNYANQDVLGTNTNAPWGMWSDKISQYILYNQADLVHKGISVKAGSAADMAFVHPIFLYESLWCLLGFIVLCIVCKKYRQFSGQLILGYGVWYGAGRAVIDGFRIDSMMFFHTGIRVSQVLSVLLALVCAFILVKLWMKFKKNPQPIEGIDYFPDEAVKKKEKTSEAEHEALTENTANEEIQGESQKVDASPETLSEDDMNNPIEETKDVIS